MSIIKSIQDYLTQYDGMEMKPIREVLTDTVDNIGEFALAPSGNSLTITDILGNRTYVNNYVFYAKEAAAFEVDRVENYDFLEDFTDWIETQDDAQNFPSLSGNYIVTQITPTNAMLFDIDEDGSGIYQIQLQVVIERRKQWRKLNENYLRRL